MAQLNLTITQEEMQALLQQDPRQFHEISSNLQK